VLTRRVDLTRTQILAYRRNVQALDERLPAGSDSLRRAAWAGLQDSTPRAALLSIHARVQGTGPSTWEDASLVQLWGPRFSAYGIAHATTLDRLAERLSDHSELLGATDRTPFEDVREHQSDQPSMWHVRQIAEHLGVRMDVRQAAEWKSGPDHCCGTQHGRASFHVVAISERFG